MNTGRNFIGFELDSHFYEIAKKRITAARQKQKGEGDLCAQKRYLCSE